MARPRWTEETILKAIDDWTFIHGEMPEQSTWKKALGSYPSAQTVRQRFGSWKKAIDRYLQVYKPETVAKEEGRVTVQWTKESIIEALQTWAEEHSGYAPTAKDAREARGAERPLPSPSVVARNFGSWNAGLEAAGLQTMPRGTTYRSVKKYLPLPRR